MDMVMPVPVAVMQEGNLQNGPGGPPCKVDTQVAVRILGQPVGVAQPISPNRLRAQGVRI